MQLTKLAIPAVAIMLSAGCGNDDPRMNTGEAPFIADSPSPATTQPAGGAGAAGAASVPAGARRTGSITIAEESWSIVPAVQCGIYPGEVVSIAGHAADAESIEIVLDHDAQRGPVQARVQGENGDPHWLAGRGTAENDLTFEVDGNRVTGSGTFTEMGSGAKANGSFEVAC